MTNNRKQERLLNLMLRSFRRYHLFHEFNKLNLQTNRVALVRDRDKINGAFLLLKRFKNRLKAFDEAMQALDRSKVDMKEFQKLSQSLDFSRSETIFKDMVALVDSNSKSFETKL